MEKIDLPFFCQLGAAFTPITGLNPETVPRIDVFLSGYGLAAKVDELFKLIPSLTVCKGNWAEYKKVIDGLFAKKQWSDPWDMPADQWQLSQLKTKASEFQVVLTSELSTLATYHASRKGIYDTAYLIERADELFSEAIRVRFNADVTEEIRQSGRCLAFDNATAAGFHAMRAVEAVMHDYYIAICKPVPPAKLDNWGAYIKELHETNDADAKRVVALLQQLKDHDRNLIMHPEVVLTADDAFALFQIAQAAIVAMADKLPKSKPAAMEVKG